MKKTFAEILKAENCTTFYKLMFENGFVYTGVKKNIEGDIDKKWFKYCPEIIEDRTDDSTGILFRDMTLKFYR